MAIEPGQHVLHYRLLEKIGEGGMGQVWKAADTRLGRSVAIKVLRQNVAREGQQRKRFEREARTISSLNHPHICTLYDIGRHGDVDFLVMEHLDGDVLAQRLRSGALPLEEALRTGIEIAEALHEAHRAGVIHRDLKPGNLMLTRYGVKLMDFGLARIVRPAVANRAEASTADPDLTQSGAVLGTMPYMAPEQLEGVDLDARCDIFALGNVLYEMVTGRRAFRGDSQARLIAAILTSDPPPLEETSPAIPPLLDPLVRRCLAKRPRDRWQSALDVARELERVRDGDAARPHRPAARPARRARYRVEYFKGPDGASVAAARASGDGRPLLVVPAMIDTIETAWPLYAEAFPDHELITYDRRGTGLSEREALPSAAEPYLNDVQTVIDGFGLEELDVLGTLMGTTEAAWIAARNGARVRRLVLRAPTLGLGDWALIPGVRAALAAMREDWEYFTESFAQFVVGWGNPNARNIAERFRAITTRNELHTLLDALRQFDLSAVYTRIQAPTLVEHHPGYFFPDLYSRRIASMIPHCRMEVFSGADHEFIGDLTIAHAFLSNTGNP